MTLCSFFCESFNREMQENVHEEVLKDEAGIFGALSSRMLIYMAEGAEP